MDFLTYVWDPLVVDNDPSLLKKKNNVPVSLKLHTKLS